MERLKCAVVSLLSGFAGMLILWTAIFFIAPNIVGVAFLWPGFVLLPILDYVIPKDLVYFLFPSGGLDATAGVAGLFALVIWWFLGATMAFLVLRKRKKNTE